MDRMIYVAASGAKQSMSQQATVAHNLANLSTNGFRAEISAFRAVPLRGDGAPTRTFVIDSTPGFTADHMSVYSLTPAGKRAIWERTDRLIESAIS